MRHDYRLLGPFEVDVDGRPLALGRRQQRALLAILLLRVNKPISTDELVELLWPQRRPGKPLVSIQGYVSGLRKLLGAETIETVGGGYRLCAGPETLDACRFEQLLAEGRDTLARPDEARRHLEVALALWRGPALADFTYETWAQDEANRLEELRLVAREHLVEAQLALGGHTELIGELVALVREQPLRERPRAQLMLALYRAGRQADALEEYRVVRELLVDQLGIEPGAELQELQRSILNQDDALAAPARPEDPLQGADSNLPVPADSFVGRHSELRDVTELLSRPEIRLVSLVGPGGSGKTRLAIELGRRLASTFSDGVHWSSLGGIADESVVGAAIAQAAGAQSPESVGDRDSLLIVDNAEHVLAEVAAGVSAMLGRTEALTVLVTTRERLQVHGEHAVPLASLADDDAASLFRERATALRPGFGASPTTVAHLCRRLDALPLAIELAAARTPVFSVEQILERLEERPEFLKGGRDVDSRQRTLEATIGWSYDLLPVEQEDLLQQLSVFAGGFDLDAAEAVVPADSELLESLVEKSLVQVTPQSDGALRFGLLETIRAFAGARLAGRPEAAAALRRVHASYYLGLAEEHDPQIITPDQLPAVDWFEREVDNIRAAAAVLAASGDGGCLGRLAVATTYVMNNTHPEEHWAWVERALELAADDADLTARLLAIGAFNALAQGRLEDADRYSRALLADAEASGEPAALSRALEERGLVLGGDEGRAMLRRAVELAESLDDANAAARTAINLGAASLAAGAYEDAAAESGHALELVRKSGNRIGIAVSLLNIAVASYFLGDLETAARSTSEARDLAEAVRNRGSVATAMLIESALTVRRGDLDQAARELEEAEAIFHKLNLTLEAGEERLRREVHELLGERRETTLDA